MEKSLPKFCYVLLIVLLCAMVLAGCASPSMDDVKGGGHEDRTPARERAPDPDHSISPVDPGERKDKNNGSAAPREKEEEGSAGKGAAEAVKEQDDPVAKKETTRNSETAYDSSTASGGKESLGNDTAGKVEDEGNVVFISIKGPAEKGLLLEATAVEQEADDTVLDVLQRVTRRERIQMEYRGRGGTSYVEGIDNIYEFDHGPGSGWIYAVNGHFPDRSSGAWQVEEGDRIEWFYSVDFGRDLGREAAP